MSALVSRPATLYLWVGVGVLSVSLASIFIRLAETDPLTVAAYRMVIGAIVVGGCVADTGEASVLRCEAR